ncbi:uncharacterized protein LOC131008304 [Salvia miltiorrhiza]|uniref:uncharacterized protein LOC131008304 n=1 Tax=Salvia miltiorrhiza TaxID=226208 RepID=UPI0025ABFF76|nr:uncharacterized protein LOC131008304 [Salvia miltiorrhiza]
MDEEVRYVMGESVSAVIQRKLPTKRKDPGMFTIPCNIGGTNMDKAMMDLGASINVMPLAVYKRLNIGAMRNTLVVTQLADRSNAYPGGVVEDVLIKVGDLIFPADFYVLDTGPETGENAILLERSLMMTTGTKIDMKTEILTCEFDGVQEEFNIYETMKRKQEMETMDMINVFETLVQEHGIDFGSGDTTKKVIQYGLTDRDAKRMEDEDIKEAIMELYSLRESTLDAEMEVDQRIKDVRSIQLEEQQQKLPKHLQYAYLGPDETLPVIISVDLTLAQEEHLVRVLRENRKAIGWTLADIKGISPTEYMQHIYLDEGTKPV